MNTRDRLLVIPTSVGSVLRGHPRVQRATVASLILLGGLGTAGALVATTPSTPADPPEERAWPVSVHVAAPALRSPSLTAFGRIESASVSRLEARLAAPVAEVHVRDGERVEADQLLVRLDDTDARLALADRDADVSDARAQLETMRNAASLASRTAHEHEALARMAIEKLERFESLFERGMVARDLLDEVRREASRARIDLERHRTELADHPHRIAQAEARLQRAEVARDRARIDLERTRIHAPFPGPVVRVDVARGDQVMVGTPLLTLVDENSVEIRVPIPADAASHLRAQLAAGQQATAYARIGKDALEVPLARLAGDQRDGSTVVDAFFRLDARNRDQVGQVVDVRLVLPAEADLISVPVQALYEHDRIYRVEDDRLVAVEAEVVGETMTPDGFRMLVRAPGIASGDRIITTQLPRAMTGLRVRTVGETSSELDAPGERLAAQGAAADRTPAG